jgi:hypothetical protein
MTLLQALHLMAATLSPSAPRTFDASPIMAEIAKVVGEDTHSPAFGSKLEDAAAMLETAWEESRFKRDAVGDHGRALCAYQLQRAPRAVLNSLWLCTSIAYARMRQSVAVCHDAPWAPYVGGSCTNRTARKVSARRSQEMARVLTALGEES